MDRLSQLALAYPVSRAMVLIAMALVGLRAVQLSRDLGERSAAPGRSRVAGLLLPLLESFFRLLVAAIFIGPSQRPSPSSPRAGFKS